MDYQLIFWSNRNHIYEKERPCTVNRTREIVRNTVRIHTVFYNANIIILLECGFRLTDHNEFSVFKLGPISSLLLSPNLPRFSTVASSPKTIFHYLFEYSCSI